MVPVLTLVHHPDPECLGRQVPLQEGQELILGRQERVFGEGVMDDPRLSRNHCRVVLEAGAVLVEDQGSRNGTYVNGERVQARNLRVGDLIGVGHLLVMLAQLPERLMLHGTYRLIGNSPAMTEMFTDMTRLAPGSDPVLILGETGTGKRRVAGELHRMSGHRGPYGVLDCAGGSLPPWDRVRARIGMGVVLFTEFEHAPALLQRSVRDWLRKRTPGEDGLRLLVTASSSLSMLAENGRFDAELAAILQDRVVEVPPLRRRAEDVLPLAWGFARLASGGATRPLSQRLALALSLHPWPNNVQELKKVMLRLVAEQPDMSEPLKAPAWLIEGLRPQGSESRAMLRINPD